MENVYFGRSLSNTRCVTINIEKVDGMDYLTVTDDAKITNALNEFRLHACKTHVASHLRPFFFTLHPKLNRI